ncbi:MAG: hypothetical protein NC821_00685, partial [Candidatus Omnitrophica bacterium]|nr:hypothetical protein [Candidatus Omnitrophota bacterium]
MLKIFLVLNLFSVLPKPLESYFEIKIILVDVQNKLIAIDKGRADGIEEKMSFSLYRQNKFIGDCLVLKAGNYVAICEIRNPVQGIELRTNEKLFMLNPEEQAEREKKELSSVSSEEEMRSKAQELVKEEAERREMAETLMKEKAKGIAEVV